MNAREIAERIAFNYLREGGTLSELIERAILDGERLGQEQMREKAASCMFHYANGNHEDRERASRIRNLEISTPEA